MQSKKYSFIESITNVIIGYVVALISQLIIFPFFDTNVSLQNNIKIGLWFTMISICRSYVLRRIFNRRVENEFPLSHFDYDDCSYDHGKLEMYGSPCPECGIVEGSDMK